MIQHVDALRVWCPQATRDDKRCIVEVLTGVDASFGTPLLRKYLEFIQPYVDVLGVAGGTNRARENDCLASGIVFFYGCLCYILHFSNAHEHIHDIVLYNILYMLVDHYIDDMKVETAHKHDTIAIMKDMLLHSEKYQDDAKLQDAELTTIAKVYHELITRCPRVRTSLMKLFYIELQGLEIQNTAHAESTAYYETALSKGAHTMLVLNDILGTSGHHDAAYNIGIVMQLIDDSVDVHTDISNGIHTIATHELKTKGSLDSLWCDIATRIHNLDPRFTIFKIIYSIFAVYLPDRIHDAYSDDLRLLTTPLNLFDYNFGCDGSELLTHAILDELLAIELARDTAHK